MKAYIDYYKLLGLESTASPNEIKRAYLSYARQFHPDRHYGRDSEDKASLIFQEISEAYYVLSDPDLRSQYDRATFRHPFSRTARREHGLDRVPGGEKRSYRNRFRTSSATLNFVIEFAELIVMLAILALPFIAPFILIYCFLLFFKF